MFMVLTRAFKRVHLTSAFLSPGRSYLTHGASVNNACVGERKRIMANGNGNGNGGSYKMIGGKTQAMPAVILYYISMAMAIIITLYDAAVWGTLIAQPGTGEDRDLNINAETLFILAVVGAGWSFLGWVVYAITTVLLDPETMGPNRLWNFAYLWSSNFLVHFTVFVCWVTIYGDDKGADPLPGVFSTRDLVTLIIAITYIVALAFLVAFGLHGVYALFYALKISTGGTANLEGKALQRKAPRPGPGSVRLQPKRGSDW